MGTTAVGLTLRVRMSEELYMARPFCAECGEELEVETVVFFDVISSDVYHLKNCRRNAVKKTAKLEQLTPNQLVRRFGVDRPTASRIVGEVKHNGSQ